MEAFVLWHRTAPAPHDEDADPTTELSWVRNVRGRFEAAGASIVGPLGGSIAAVFHLEDGVKAVDTALAILDEAEKAIELSQAPRVAFGGSIGELDFAPAIEGRSVEYLGGAIDRAQLLANRARAGQLVLDGRAREAVSSSYLFLRTIGTGEPALRGHAIDREEPRVANCRRHLMHLGRAPTPSIVGDAFAPLREAAQSTKGESIVIRGPAGSGARRCVAEAEFAARPALSLRCMGVPQGLEPLGSLRVALVRAYGPGAARLARIEALELASADVLCRIARGDAVSADDAYAAMVALLSLPRDPGTNRPWIVVDPIHEVDESTLDFIARLAVDQRVDALIVALVRPETTLPHDIARAPGLRTIEVPRLLPEHVRALVGAMIREPESGEIARRVAQTPADTPLAVVECLRTFIASGDVVRRGRSFVFRIGPRAHDDRSGCTEWISERVALLDDASHRLVELLAIAPPGLPKSDLDAIALADGSDARTIERSVTRLRDDRMIVTAPFVELDHAILRDTILGQMPGPRRAELASAISARLGKQAGFARATLGTLLAEAGAEGEAAHAFLDTAEAAAESGHPRAAIRLASAAVQASPSPESRTRAAAVLRGVTVRIPAATAERSTDRQSIEVPAESVESPARVVVDAFRARDLDRIDRLVDLAIAEGASLAAADRWRAMVALLRGDSISAETAVARSRERVGSLPESRIRTAVVSALVDLYAGRTNDALRTLLEALATARDTKSAVAEPAIKRALTMCFETLGYADASARLLGTTPTRG